MRGESRLGFARDDRDEGRRLARGEERMDWLGSFNQASKRPRAQREKIKFASCWIVVDGRPASEG